MSSKAQDARHEQLVREAKEDVVRLEREVEAKKAELRTLEGKLEEAKKELALHESIGLGRD
jgi:predicted RNase H-like nuclease (RuvC/YqgF family)